MNARNPTRAGIKNDPGVYETIIQLFMGKNAMNGRLRLGIVVAIVTVLSAAPAASATVIFVNDDATGLNDGSDWANAFTDLQSALAFAVDGDEIWVAEGTYRPAAPFSGDRITAFELNSSADLYGGFDGTEGSVAARAGLFDTTILNGDIDGNDAGGPGHVTRTENSFQVMRADSSTNFVLDGFTISGGNCDVAPCDGGAGLSISASGIRTIRNCTFASNEALFTGGAVRISAGITEISRCRFFGNKAAFGGGVAVVDGAAAVVAIDHCLLYGNAADDAGGAIYVNTFGDVTLRSSVVALNVAGAEGAGIFTAVAPMVIRNSIVYHNVGSPQIDGAGGADVAFSCVQNLSSPGFGNTADDPLFINIDITGDTALDFSLRSGSPCIDAGDNAEVVVVGDSGIDFNGNARFVEDPGTPDTGNGTAPIVDMGAIEFQGTTITQIVYVDASASGLADGTSWDDAYTTLQDALTAAANPSGRREVWVAAATYKPDQGGGQNPGDVTATFQLDSLTGIYGGFNGTEPVRGDRNPAENVTILDGDIDDDGAPGGNSFHVVTASGVNTTAVLDGFTISGGNAVGGLPSGGGLLNLGGSPDIANSIFISNNAGEFLITTGLGGGVYTEGAFIAKFTNCRFLGNTASFGGGMYSETSELRVTNCAFSGNSSTADGGALFALAFTANVDEVTNSTFFANESVSGSGGIKFAFSGESFVRNCILWDNTSGVVNGEEQQISGTGGTAVTTSLIQSLNLLDAHGAGNTLEDPLFVDAPGPDGAPGTLDDDLRVFPGSPAIDRGSNFALPAGIVVDLDGNSRIVDDFGVPPGPFPDSGPIDLGAYEFQGTTQVSRIIYVDTAASGAADGSSWINAFTTLQDALAEGPDPAGFTQIWVAAATYNPDQGGGNTPGDRTATFLLNSRIEMYGGFDGTESFVEERDPQANETILSGDLLGDDDLAPPSDPFENSADNSVHVLLGNTVNKTAVVDGFTITGGNAPDALQEGGGIKNVDSRPQIKNCKFFLNSASFGGAISATLNSAVSISNCSFILNRALGPVQGVSGGAIYMRRDGTVRQSAVTITACRFFGNTAARGGAIYSEGVGPAISNSVFSGNRAFIDNGGAVAVRDSTLDSLTFLMRLVNCSFTKNVTELEGGGLWASLANGSILIVANSIFWGNDSLTFSGTEIAQIVESPAGLMSVEYSVIQNAQSFSGSPGVIDADPKFFDANGFDDIDGTEDDNLSLLPGSPCIDAGINIEADAAGLTTDIDGRDRFLDDEETVDTGAGTPPIVDMGAIEFTFSLGLGDELLPPEGFVVDPDPLSQAIEPTRATDPLKAFYHAVGGRWYANEAGLVEMKWADVDNPSQLIPVLYVVGPIVNPDNPRTRKVRYFPNYANAQAHIDADPVIHYNSIIVEDCDTNGPGGNPDTVDDFLIQAGMLSVQETPCLPSFGQDPRHVIFEYNEPGSGLLLGFEVVFIERIASSLDSDAFAQTDLLVPIGRRIVEPDPGQTYTQAKLSTNTALGAEAAWQREEEDGTGTTDIYPIRPQRGTFANLAIVWYRQTTVADLVNQAIDVPLGEWPIDVTRYQSNWPDSVMVCTGGTNDRRPCSDNTDCPDGGTCGIVSSQTNVIDPANPVPIVDLRLGDLYSAVDVMFEEGFNGTQTGLTYPESITAFDPAVRGRGYSVLKFECGTAPGCDFVTFEVLRTFEHFENSPSGDEVFDGSNPRAWTVGTPIEQPSLHDADTSDFPFGYLHAGFPFAPCIYDDSGPDCDPGEGTRQIIPVNESNIGGDPEHGLLEVWFFERGRDIVEGDFAAEIRWPHVVHTYVLDWPTTPCADPVNSSATCRQLIIASRLGFGLSGFGVTGPLSYGPAAKIYKVGQKGDDLGTQENTPGWNPNDEHASLIPIGAARMAFATRDDNPWNYNTGHPYVLVQYFDISQSEWRMDVVKVVDTLTPFDFTYDTFASFSESSGFLFPDVLAGLPLNPPLFPVNFFVLDATPCAGDTLLPVDVGLTGLWSDRTNQIWTIKDELGTVKLHELWGEDNDNNCEPYLDAGTGTPTTITYDPDWPPICGTNVPCARPFSIGDTEDVSAACSIEKPMLHDDVGVFVIDPGLEVGVTYECGPGLVPDFGLLPPHLAAGRAADDTFPPNRISCSNSELKFVGIMSDNDETALLSADIWGGGPIPSEYSAAIPLLKIASRAQLDPAFDPLSESNFQPHISMGNPLAKPGFVTVGINNDLSCGASPVDVRVWNVACPPATPSVNVFSTACPFGETVVLQVDHDAGGAPETLFYQWQFKEIGDPTWRNFFANDSDVEGTRELIVSGAAALADKDFRVRYRGYGGCPCDSDPGTAAPDCPVVGDGEDEWKYSTSGVGTAVTEWSDTIIVEGWLKRLVKGLNEFDSRISNFHDASGVNLTYLTMIETAGQPFDGSAILSCDPENLQQIGLIEAYSSAAQRAESFTIAQRAATPAENLAILFITGKIADLYVLLGNEALADSSDPTTGVDTGEGGDPVSVPSALYAFEGEVGSPLEEELALLRGTDQNEGFPRFNRLRWNFGPLSRAEAAYVGTYNLVDKDLDGFITLADGRIMFPFGHGDAWGHFLTAMKKHYRLLRENNFEWIIATETIPSGTGGTTPVRYQFERRFAQSAAAKARTGAAIVDLTFRDRFNGDPTTDPGFPDTDTDRAWGLTEWAQRAGQGAYFDWVMANALLDDDDSTHSGLERVDRTTVPELQEIASAFNRIQVAVTNAGNGLNPLGLASNVVPFGINAEALEEGTSHYEQVRCWAVQQLENAKTLFDYANNNIRRLRTNEDDANDFSVAVTEEELDFKARLIEIYGRPFPESIGVPGGYPGGYDGPDVFFFEYVDPSPLLGQTDFTADPFTSKLTRTFTDYDGLLNGDPLSPVTVAITFNVSTVGLGLIKPASWSLRPEPGEIQLAKSELLQAIGELQQGIEAYSAHLQNIEAEIAAWSDLTQLNSDVLGFITSFQTTEINLNKKIVQDRDKTLAFQLAAEASLIMADGIAEAIPEIFGFSNSAGAIAKGTVKIAAAIPWDIFTLLASLGELSELQHAQDLEEAATQLEIDITRVEASFEEGQQLRVIEQLIRETPAVRLEIFLHIEAINQANGRYLQALGRGSRLLDARTLARKKFAGTATDFRYKDLTFRLFRNESLQKYRAMFDLAARYVFLAAKAYDYETNLLGSDAESARAFLASIVKQRTLGVVPDNLACDQPLPPPVAPNGLADLLGSLDQQFQVILQNRFVGEINRSFGLRRQLFRVVGDDDEAWRAALSRFQVPDLNNVLNYRLFASQLQGFSGSNSALVIPFSTTNTEGLNFFGWRINGPDFPSGRYAIKLRSFSVLLHDHPDLPLLNPFVDVFLIPVGSDIMRTPAGPQGSRIRVWNLLDQTLPPPQPVGGAFTSADWVPWDTWTASGIPGNPRLAVQRRHIPSIGACDPTKNECDVSTALAGRSVWNTRWLLIIPGSSLSNKVLPEEAIDTFINGSGGGGGVSDIELVFNAIGYDLNTGSAAEEGPEEIDVDK